MGAQSIQKVSIVRNDHRCPLKLPESLFERSQRLDVQVIRWLIQQNQVGALAESLANEPCCVRRHSDRQLFSCAAPFKLNAET